MSIIQGSAHTSTGGYQIERSLRFNSADSAYLNRTPGSAGNRDTWTFSGWVKRSKLGMSNAIVFGSGDTYVNFETDRLAVNLRAAATNYLGISTAKFRDTSAWYHIVVAVDTTQATAANRLKMWVNNQLITAFDISSYLDIPVNTDTAVNSTNAHNIGRYTGGGEHFDGYLTEVNFIDGQALTPSSFGETDAITGVWKPKAYSGTYGTNGFFLKFADNSGTTSTTLGKDSSSNGNNWTPNNFSVTAGAGNDSLVDTPTPYGTDTGVGGTVRGNYSTLNPLNLKTGLSLANGNLAFSNSGNTNRSAFSTAGMTSGKWYCEVKYSSINLNAIPGVVYDDSSLESVTYIGNRANGYGYESSGLKYNNGSGTSYGASWTTSDTIGIALDLDNLTVTFYKNGTSQGTAFSSLPSGKTWFFGFDSYGSGAGGDVNFGQRAFAYTAPSGFKALCTQNLPTPAVVQGDDYFNPVLYTGTGSSLGVTGVGFQPDFTWIKSRSEARSHALFDVLRGATIRLYSDSTVGDQTESTTLTAFNSDGFTVSTSVAVNNSAQTYVAWNWKAGGTGVTNTAGQITSTVSANTTAGFSIVTFTTDNTTKTVGHGLGVKPSLVIVKSRSVAGNWLVITDILGSMQYGVLNSTAAFTSIGYSAPTSTVFSYNDNNGVTQVAYCFAPVAGYSAFGSYTGNGSTDGPFVYTGFRPRWIMIKRTDTTGNWQIQDTARTPYNWTCAALFPDSSAAEITNEAEATYGRDYLSNGFKIRASHTSHNASGGTYIYMAFAENPFKHSLAR